MTIVIKDYTVSELESYLASDKDLELEMDTDIVIEVDLDFLNHKVNPSFFNVNKNSNIKYRDHLDVVRIDLDKAYLRLSLKDQTPWKGAAKRKGAPVFSKATVSNMIGFFKSGNFTLMKRSEMPEVTPPAAKTMSEPKDLSNYTWAELKDWLRAEGIDSNYDLRSESKTRDQLISEGYKA